MNETTNTEGKKVFINAENSTPFSAELFHEVPPWETDTQHVLHTNLGSLTVVDRMTGFGWIDTETGYRNKAGNFWLASGGYDVRDSGCKTLGEAIEWVKANANTCIPDLREVM